MSLSAMVQTMGQSAQVGVAIEGKSYIEADVSENREMQRRQIGDEDCTLRLPPYNNLCERGLHDAVWMQMQCSSQATSIEGSRGNRHLRQTAPLSANRTTAGPVSQLG